MTPRKPCSPDMAGLLHVMPASGAPERPPGVRVCMQSKEPLLQAPAAALHPFQHSSWIREDTELSYGQGFLRSKGLGVGRGILNSRGVEFLIG